MELQILIFLLLIAFCFLFYFSMIFFENVFGEVGVLFPILFILVILICIVLFSISGDIAKYITKL